ncbi:MAG: DUF2085 domain-containing protein [Ignavibacteriales bacterium]|nr:DUF2085 domain-containing protein [Ignavibacteriales bacterium]
MEQANKRPIAHNLSRWLVPLAALIVFGVWFYIAPPGRARQGGFNRLCQSVTALTSVPSKSSSRQLPLCARCTGEFYAAGITLLFFAFVSPKKSGMPGWKLGAPLLCSCSPSDWTARTPTYTCSNKPQRAPSITSPTCTSPTTPCASLRGAAWALRWLPSCYPAFNSSAWKTHDPAPAARLEKTWHPHRHRSGH